MGWKGVLRSIESEIRRSARNAERKQKQQAKQRVLEDAKNTVRAFENYVENIISIHHKLSSDSINWENLLKKSPPEKPEYKNDNELKAKHKYENFKPNFFHKIFKCEKKKKENLKLAINKATTKDGAIYKNIVSGYEDELSAWEKTNTLAKRLINKEITAYQEVVEKYNPFSNIENLGSSVVLSVKKDGNIIVVVNVHSDEVIPSEKYSLRQSGSLSTKSMPKGEFNELYQDYVCSCVLRIAGELFALLPIKSLIINANDDLLNSQTGHIEEQTILSALIVRENYERINLSQIDPSDSMNNFIHKMNFKKSSGFFVVDPVEFKNI